jgi:hypothetical protein
MGMGAEPLTTSARDREQRRRVSCAHADTGKRGSCRGTQTLCCSGAVVPEEEEEEEGEGEGEEEVLVAAALRQRCASGEATAQPSSSAGPTEGTRRAHTVTDLASYTSTHDDCPRSATHRLGDDSESSFFFFFFPRTMKNQKKPPSTFPNLVHHVKIPQETVDIHRTIRREGNVETHSVGGNVDALLCCILTKAQSSKQQNQHPHTHLFFQQIK